jgi:hypothetical protein
MKRTTKTAILIAICSMSAACSFGETFVARGMQNGLRRDYGHGFYGIDRVNKDPRSWEGYQYTRDIYYRGTRLGDAGFATVSPSGRYALFEWQADGGWVLFDSHDFGIYRLQREAMRMPTIERWTADESRLIISHYGPHGGKRDTKEIVIGRLKRIKTARRSADSSSQ